MKPQITRLDGKGLDAHFDASKELRHEAADHMQRLGIRFRQYSCFKGAAA